MSTRRSLIIGGGCLAAAGAAYGFTPRRKVSLLGDVKLASLVPMNVGGWTARDVSDLIAPPTDDSLEAKLYGEQVERVYQDGATGAQVMMLLAHGATQSNDLMVHRPEVCYPAFGFRLSNNHQIDVPIAANVAVPGRMLVADAPDRRETIIYWTRMGNLLPVDESEQRWDRVKLAMKGVVADGVLSRFSMVGDDTAANFTLLAQFVAALLQAAPSAGRRALIGADLGAALDRVAGR